MQDEQQNIKYYSTFLIRLAWTVEVIAVLIGFTISILMSVSAFNSISTFENISFIDSASAIVIAGLPFLLVAAVELCKIPLVFAFMATRNLWWRSIFLFFVFFLCIITFETMLNGFERNFSNLSRAIDNRKNEILNVDTEIELLEKRRAHVQKFTEEELMAEIAQEDEQSQLVLDENLARIEASKNQQLTSINANFEPKLKQEIAELMTIRDGYYKDWNEEKVLIEERFTSTVVSNVSGSKDERERLLAELEALKAEMKREMDDASFLTEASVERKYRQLIREKEQMLATITTGYLGGGALEKQSLMENQLRQQIEFVNSKYDRRIKDINERIDEKKAEIQSRYNQNARLRNSIVAKARTEQNQFIGMREDNLAELAEYEATKRNELERISQQVFGFEEQIFKLRNEQRLLNTQINHLINQNQVYRIAMYVTGKDNAAEVGRSTVGIVALVWFGSLALIAAVTGVMLALASFYLKREARNLAKEEVKPSSEQVNSESDEVAPSTTS
ncbi:hypothetical protein L2725_19605 [Shewanella corallii]|uniref:Lipopolysaccharide biosynthesis protein n=1 Tax=Shewanella corallii TaxID=560080 RepID=A0ABT0NBV8_9GAMM|nr:hypothetical protein [Shewanella corallii]MCL2915953.1 hypothetical protein [Shewanella corallii]